MRTYPAPRIPGCKKALHRRLLDEINHALRTTPALVAVTLLLPAPALAIGELALTHGSATVRQSPGLTQITQQSQRATFETLELGLAPDEQLDVNAPSSSAYTLIRDTGNTASAIYGRITANDHLFLINPRGILFGRGAQIDVHGLVATTLDIDDHDFMAGNYRFASSDRGGTGQVINQGSIIADHGYVVLAGDYVENSGLIEARLGEVALASGSRLTMDLAGDGLISLAVDEATMASRAGVKNMGQLKADGGRVLMTAKVAGELVGSVVNNEGLIQARTIGGQEGEIVLLGGMEQGTVEVGGILDASAPGGGNGGFIETSGHTVKIKDEAIITTAAPFGRTGTWLIDPFDFFIRAIGGNITGAALSNALATNNVIIRSVDGTTPGNGDLFVDDHIFWTANTELTLEAINTIFVNAEIDSAGLGGVTMQADADADGNGTVSFGALGHLATADGLATIYYNPTSYSTPTDFTPFYTPGEFGLLLTFMLVNNLDDLQAINTNLNGTYAQGRDIDAAATRGWNGGAGFVPLGGVSNQFAGVFDGRHHTISNLFINRPDTQYVGLFGGVADGANLRHIGLVNVDITGGFQTGGLAAHIGVNAGVFGSFTSGKVTGMSNTVGGLVGLNAGAIDHSYSTAEVSGQVFVGGLTGANWGGAALIKDSYSTGKVTGTSSVGGLVGSNYNTGPAPVVDSFWDTETSGLTTSAGGIGKSTAAMKQQATYTNWDFTNTWEIAEGQTYPQLQSFKAPLPPPPPEPLPEVTPPAPTPEPIPALEERQRVESAVDTITSVLAVTPDLADRGVDTPLQTELLASDRQPADSEDTERSKEAEVTLEEAAQKNELGQRPLFSLDNGAVAGQNMVCN